MQRKIFVIGFNKTASSTLHKLFISNKLRSVHDDTWVLHKYDCFTDRETDGILNFETYYNKFPNAVFVLNTRSLDSWLLSRLTHGFLHKQAWAWPPNLDKVKLWIEIRQTHYNNVLNFFKNKPENLFVVNIEKPLWLEFLSEQLNLSIPTVKAANVTPTINNNNIKTLITDVVATTFRDLNFTETQQSACFTPEQLELVKLYKNNFF
jgi:hypothetical protein